MNKVAPIRRFISYSYFHITFQLTRFFIAEPGEIIISRVPLASDLMWKSKLRLEVSLSVPLATPFRIRPLAS